MTTALVHMGESLHRALLLDYVPPKEPPSTPRGKALRTRWLGFILSALRAVPSHCPHSALAVHTQYTNLSYEGLIKGPKPCSKADREQLRGNLIASITAFTALPSVVAAVLDSYAMGMLATQMSVMSIRYIFWDTTFCAAVAPAPTSMFSTAGDVVDRSLRATIEGACKRNRRNKTMAPVVPRSLWIWR